VIARLDEDLACLDRASFSVRGDARELSRGERGKDVIRSGG